MSLKFEQHRLSNGLTILAETNPHAHTFSAGLFVKTGAVDEPVDINGVSHFLEHMMFKGSAKLDWQAMNRIFDDMGARYNAFTTQEMTAYYATVLPEFTTPVMEHLGELLRPALRQEDFDTEKKVILEEIAMYEDEPSHRLYELLMARHFEAHPLGRSVLGPADTIRNMSRDQMKAYFDSRYGPANMVLSVAGKLDFAEVVRLAEKLYGHWTGPDVDRHHVKSAHAARDISISDPKLNRTYVMAMTPGPSSQDPMRFAARVLGDVLGDAEGSRLYWDLVDPAIAEEADFGFYPHDGTGSFYVSLVTSPHNTDKAISIAQKVLKDATKTGIKADEIERARNKLVSGLTLSGEQPSGRMRSLGFQWMYMKEYRSLEQDIASLMSVDAKQMGELMSRYPFEPMTLVRLGP
jgi:predicted Zn-dependent peptidase